MHKVFKQLTLQITPLGAYDSLFNCQERLVGPSQSFASQILAVAIQTGRHLRR